MFKKSTYCFLVLLFLLTHSLSAEENNKCNLPYKPSNIFKVVFNYSEGMTYISGAKEICSNIFAQKILDTFRDSIWISEGCLEVTLNDIKKAKNARKVKPSSSLVDSIKNKKPN